MTSGWPAHEPASPPSNSREPIHSEIDAERDQLRERRAFLEREHAALLVQSTRLADSHDWHALHAHTIRLTQHHEGLMAFADALESFHHRHGPLD